MVIFDKFYVLSKFPHKQIINITFYCPRKVDNKYFYVFKNS